MTSQTSIGSLLNDPIITADQSQANDPAGWMFHSIPEAWEWCEMLSSEDLKYLVETSRYIRELPLDKTIDCSLVKPDKIELFYRSASYTMLMFNLFDRLSFSNDYKVLKCIAQVPENCI